MSNKKDTKNFLYGLYMMVWPLFVADLLHMLFDITPDGGVFVLYVIYVFGVFLAFLVKHFLNYDYD